MAFTTAQRLMQLGVATPLAKELGRQMDTGVYSVFRLIEMGMDPGLAKIVITQPFNPVKAMQLGMTGPVATLVAGGGTVPISYDTFQRADTATGLGLNESGWTWFNGTNFRILSNAIRLVTPGGAGGRRYAYAHNLTNDFESKITVEVPASGDFDIGHVLRADAADSSPRLYTKFCYSQSVAQLVINIGGGDVTLLDVPFSYTLGRTYEFKASLVGAAVEMFVNGVSIGSHSLSGANVTGLGVYRDVGVTAHELRDNGSRILKFENTRIGSKVILFPHGIVGHRGLYRGPFSVTGDPENSLACLQTTPRGRVAGVEIDSRSPTDGGFILNHDETYDRTTNGTGNVADQTKAYALGLTIDGPNGGSVVEASTFMQAAARTSYSNFLQDYGGGSDTGAVQSYLTMLRNSGVFERCVMFVGSTTLVQTIRSLDADVRIFLGSITAANAATAVPIAAAAGVETCLLTPGDGAYAANASAIATITGAGMRAGLSDVNLATTMLAGAAAGATFLLTDYADGASR